MFAGSARVILAPVHGFTVENALVMLRAACIEG